MNDRIKYLELLLPNKEVEDKWFSKFKKFCSYLGNGVYEWQGIVSTDIRELFLMGYLHLEKIEYKKI
jgi:hypothetical protein